MFGKIIKSIWCTDKNFDAHITYDNDGNISFTIKP